MGNNWGFADDRYPDLRRAVQRLCADFPGPYWQQMDRTRAYPTAFVQAMTEAGFLAALIPEEYGGGGATIAEASAILEEINHSGANGGVCHAQMYTMGALSNANSAKPNSTKLRRSPTICSWLTWPSTSSACRGRIEKGVFRTSWSISQGFG